MASLPFSQTLWLWRTHRGLTQEALARYARIPRPNLSAMERGRREISLGTLRSLALALGVRPGVLADGVPPGVPEAQALPRSREALERIAGAVVSGKRLPDAAQQQLAQALAQITKNRLAASGRRPGARRHTRAAQAAWIWVQAAYPPAVIQNLLQRIEDAQRRHDPSAD